MTPLPKPCDRCKKRYQPTGRDCKICDKCCEKSRIKKLKRAKIK